MNIGQSATPLSAGEIRPRQTFYTRYGKRAADILLAGMGMALAAPLMLLVTAITLLDVGRPVIFRQVRIGKDCRPFTLYKFRNMTDERDETGALLPPHQRVTRVGRLLRAASLDELPQLFNILRGDMSVIGPRPLLPDYLPRYTPRDRMRHAARPGLECPPCRRLGHPRSWEEQFENDLWYVQHCGFWVDVRLCFGVLHMMLDRRGNAFRGAANRGSYREEEFGPIR